MASCILIVLGNKIRPLIDQVSQEQWFMSYIGEWGIYSMIL